MFISFDGVDGAGKSTQITMFVDWLRQHHDSVTLCRDPGSTPLGDAVRELLLGHHGMPIGARAEMLLYMAARAQLVEEVIKPALARGEAVVSDRFLLANVVYQGHAGGLPISELWQVGAVATSGVQPDMSIVLDLDVETAAARRQGAPDRLESRGDEYFRRVRAGFLAEARGSDRIHVVDASQSPEAVHQAIVQIAQQTWQWS